VRASKIDPVKAKKTIRFGAAVVFILILVLSVKPFYILNEGQTAIITQFGKIVKAETASSFTSLFTIVTLLPLAGSS